jgi:hypothetical protein
MKNKNGSAMGLMVNLALSSCVALGFVNPALGDVTNPVIGDVLFEENFNTFDSTRWNVIEGNGCPGLCGWGNQELEYYSANNVYIADVPGEPGNKAVVLEA